jgi:hypothetical protein
MAVYANVALVIRSNAVGVKDLKSCVGWKPVPRRPKPSVTHNDYFTEPDFLSRLTSWSKSAGNGIWKKSSSPLTG